MQWTPKRFLSKHHSSAVAAKWVCAADFLQNEQINLHLIRVSLLLSCRWEMRYIWKQNPKLHSSVLLRPSGLCCSSCSKKKTKKPSPSPSVWESLSSPNGRQTPQRAVEIAWKWLRRDPVSVVSKTFHWSWQIHVRTMIMKTQKKHKMLMKTNSLILRCSWRRLWHGTRKELVSRLSPLNYEKSLVKKKKKDFFGIIS